MSDELEQTRELLRRKMSELDFCKQALKLNGVWCELDFLELMEKGEIFWDSEKKSIVTKKKPNNNGETNGTNEHDRHS